MRRVGRQEDLPEITASLAQAEQPESKVADPPVVVRRTLWRWRWRWIAIFSFDVADTQYLFTLGVMLIVALVIVHLMTSIRRHGDISDARERRTAVLYAMSRELSVASDVPTMVQAAVRHISAFFHSTTAVLIADDNGGLSPVSSAAQSTAEASVLPRSADLDCARQVVARGERCIRDAIYLPLLGSKRVMGGLPFAAGTDPGCANSRAARGTAVHVRRRELAAPSFRQSPVERRQVLARWSQG